MKDDYRKVISVVFTDHLQCYTYTLLSQRDNGQNVFKTWRFWPLKKRILCGLEISASEHIVMLCHIPEEINP